MDDREMKTGAMLEITTQTVRDRGSGERIVGRDDDEENEEVEESESP